MAFIFLRHREKASNSGTEACPASVILAGENVGLLILEEEKALVV